MSKKSREEELLRRLQSAGVVERSNQVAAPFKFLISPKVSSGIDIRHLAVQFRDETFDKIRSFPFQSPITAIVLFPTILGPDVSSSPDKVTYKRGEKAVFVAVNIPFRDWDTASNEARVELLAENILESIRRISSKYLIDQDRQRLVRAVNEVRENVKTRLLH